MTGMALLRLLCVLVAAQTAFGLRLTMVSTASRPAPLAQVVDRLRKAAQYVTEQPLRLQYSTTMAARVGYFLSQGLIISRLPGLAAEPAPSPTPAPAMAPLDVAAVIGAVADAIVSDRPEDIDFVIPSVSEKAYLGSEEQRALFAKNFAAIIGLLRNDLRNIETGKYKMPFDLQPSLQNPQFNPLSVASQAFNYATDRRNVLARSRRGPEGGLEIRQSFSSDRYPDYYLRNFHFQTDGWLSTQSAKIYDYQVEALFLGTADAMRRQLLPSMGAFFNQKGAAGAGVQHLDIATGTGRFLSFVLDNWPSLEATALDLSPFYLAEAKSTLAPKHPSCKFVEAAAEQLPFPDASFDSISCVYMFHELPRDIRQRVVSEMARVLRPGGKVFFCDSAQEGEVPTDRVLEGFTILAHEPFYLDYTKQSLRDLFGASGLVQDEGSEEVCWVSKVVTFTKA